MRTIKKKAAFDVINAGMISFLTFVIVAILSVLLVNTTKTTDIVCPAIVDGDACYQSCSAGFTFVPGNRTCCSTAQYTSPAIANCSLGNKSAGIEYTGSAYNATKDLQTAAALPPQFAQIIVIVVIMVGILGMLAFVGYGAYQKLKK